MSSHWSLLHSHWKESTQIGSTTSRLDSPITSHHCVPIGGFIDDHGVKKRTSFRALTRIICKTHLWLSLNWFIISVVTSHRCMGYRCLIYVQLDVWSNILEKAMNAVANLIDVGFPPNVNQHVGVSLLICSTLSPPRTSLWHYPTQLSTLTLTLHHIVTHWGGTETSVVVSFKTPT